MCDPVSLGIAAVASAGASIGGSVMNANAQRQAANAIAEQNRTTMAAQNQGFTSRLQASLAQTGLQQGVMDATMAARNAAATQMREGQTAAMQQRQAILDAENTTAKQLRAQGDQAANQLIGNTSATNLAASQDAARQQAAALLSSQVPPITGPTATDPTGGGGTSDPQTNQATARRLAEAATNIRSYGAKVADTASYGQPAQTANLAIAGNKYGIMPAATAEQLLRTGSSVLLAPSQIAYQNATQTGNALDTLLQSRGQSGLDAASLAYNNATDISNLTQQDADTLAANKNKQAQENAAYQQSLAQLVTGVGNLAAKGTGYYAAKSGIV